VKTKIEGIQNENLQGFSEPWDFSIDEYFDAVAEDDLATFFLGSYTTNVKITDNLDGTYAINFEVINKTGWESATRLIPDEDDDGVNESIIPDKPRGQGIHLGGTIVDVFEWSEFYTP